MPVPRISEHDLPAVLSYANRIEAVAAAAMEGRSSDHELAGLIAEIRPRPAIAAGVATALTLMIDAIRDGDPAGRFAGKIAVLAEAVRRLGQNAQSDLVSRA